MSNLEMSVYVLLEYFSQRRVSTEGSIPKICRIVWSIVAETKNTEHLHLEALNHYNLY